jgi:hypothetical protein
MRLLNNNIWARVKLNTGEEKLVVLDKRVKDVT